MEKGSHGVEIMTWGEMLKAGRISLGEVQDASKKAFFKALDRLRKNPEAWDEIFRRAEELRKARECREAESDTSGQLHTANLPD